MIARRSIIIFGGTRGIGKIIAEHYALFGHRVSVAGRQERALRKFKADMAVAGVKINIVRADIQRGKDVVRVFNAHESFAGSAEVVINSAAVLGPIGVFWKMPVNKWQETVNIDLFGSFLVAREAVRRMVKKKLGSIIMFSGGGSAFARPNFSAYGAAKTGLLRLVETAACELRESGHRGIIINAIAPGAVKTRMTDQVLANPCAGEKESMEAEGVALSGGTEPQRIIELVDFLISPKENNGISGRLIHVREDYRGLVEKYKKNIPEDTGKLRRVVI